MIAPASHTQIRILKDENRRLEAYLRDLPTAQWQHPSRCAAWIIADVVAHIIMFNRQFAERILEALGSDASAPASAPQRSNDRVDATPAAGRAIELRNELGESLLSCYLDSNRDVEASFDRVGPSDWMRLCYRSTGAESIADLLQAYIVEVSVHHWDVRSPFDPGARLSPEGLSVMVGRYPHRPRWWDLPLPASHPQLPVRFRFEVPDVPTSGTDFVISGEGEQFMEPAGFTPATVLFQCDAETFILLAYGRIKPTAVLANGRLTYSGHRDWAGVFLQSFIGG